jgi:predicted amidohydrolase
VENQVFVLHASLVGDIGREPVPESYGSSAIIAPSMAPFPMEAILAETPLNEDALVVENLDIDALIAFLKANNPLAMKPEGRIIESR